MLLRLLAELTLILHFLFILFVIFGGLFVFKWNRIAWLHVPCAIWGALLEFYSWVCPLTYLENYFRTKAGDSDYSVGFVEHYLIPVIYPPGLTENTRLTLGLLVVVINLVIYGYFSWTRYYDQFDR